MDKICLNQKLFLEPTGNLRRHGIGRLREGIVASIKRKYFYVQFSDSRLVEKFDIETLKNVHDDCNSAWVIWLSKEEYKRDKERQIMVEKIRRIFSSYPIRAEELSYETISKIYKLIEFDLMEEE